jgi:hypothetical protein
MRGRSVYRAAAVLDSLTLPTHMPRRFTQSQSPSFKTDEAAHVAMLMVRTIPAPVPFS